MAEFDFEVASIAGYSGGCSPEFFRVVGVAGFVD